MVTAPKQKISEIVAYFYDQVGFEPTNLQLDILNSDKRFVFVAGC